GHADGDAIDVHHMPDHAGDGGLAVGARYGADGHAAGCACGVEHVDDGPAHVLRGPMAGVQVHAQARTRVDLDHPAVELSPDVGGDDVDAADVEADHCSCSFADLADLTRHAGRHVGGSRSRRQVGAAAQLHAGARRRHRVEGQLGARQLQLEFAVYDYLGERFLVAVAAQRVAVGLVDELGDRARAVAYYVTGFAVAGS